jgi:hypothetical protein
VCIDAGTCERADDLRGERGATRVWVVDAQVAGNRYPRVRIRRRILLVEPHPVKPAVPVLRLLVGRHPADPIPEGPSARQLTGP